MRRCWAALLVGLVVGPWTQARADCEADLKLLVPLVHDVADPGTQRRAMRYVVRALRELDEGDELDCQPAADALREILKKAPH